MEWFFPEYRLDWFGAGPSSPNKTGALLAILFVVSWWPALRFRWGFWLSLPLAFVSAALLLQTESRGALVGAGAAVMLLASLRVWQVTRADRLTTLKRRLKWKSLLLRGLSLLVAMIVLGLYAQRLGVNDRMTSMTAGEDESANVRVKLYSAGLQMIAAAPQGWGYGEAGNAYGQWYQEVGDNRSYLSLVNSHLTWMAEGGMLFQFLYITGWCFVLMFCWPVPWTPLRATALAVWVTLGLCGFFSSVLTLVWLWVIPILLLALCVIQRLRSKQWPTKRQRLTVSYSVLAAFVGLQAMAGTSSGDPRIEAAPSYLRIGEKPEAIALIGLDSKVLGDKYGHTIREYLDEVGGFSVFHAVPDKTDWAAFDIILVSGDTALPKLGEFRGELVWMNPPVDVGEATLEQLKDQSLTVVIGGLGDWRRSRIWQSLADAYSNWEVIELRGVADYIPNWPRYLKPLMDVNGRE